ncbi:MAG: ABC transporter ATP-binding protein [Myxococcales bacterium]|nr:ABC transporter ATP-binding protein [Myxococcales bacterium]
MPQALTVRRLTRSYGSRKAVDALDLEVLEGDVYGFLGPNGAGKTTAMRCILGLIRRDEGEVTLLGDTDPVRQRRGVAAIIETPAFHDWMTARQNLMQAGWYGGLSGSSLDRAIERVLERVGLVDRADERTRGYSLGMRQRLAIARCLLGEPRMLFLDEPTNGLDPAGMKDMRDLVRSLAMHDGITVLVSSHLLAEVQAICNRVGIIDRGRMRAEGTVADLLKSADQPVYRVRCASAVALAEALPAESFTVESTDGDVLLVRTALPAEDLNRRAFELGFALSMLAPVERNLEDVFLEVLA